MYYAGSGTFDLFNCEVYNNSNGPNGDGDQVFSWGYGTDFSISCCQIQGLYLYPITKTGFFETTDCYYNTAPPKPIDDGNNSNYDN